jgi:phospholipid-binding lipoprotein MlaA
MKNYLLIVITFLFISLISTSAFAVEQLPDCNEKINRAIFNFNMELDKDVIKPIAQTYNMLPSPIKTGVSNGTYNFNTTKTAINEILQGHVEDGLISSSRFVINSTLGFFGTFDPASEMGIKKRSRTDFGITLGAWGVPHGCYAVLPVFGPSSPRDGLGRLVGIYADPFYYVIGNSDPGVETYYSLEALDLLNFRAENIKATDSLEKSSIDLYATYKSLFLQKREALVNNASNKTSTEKESSDIR